MLNAPASGLTELVEGTDEWLQLQFDQPHADFYYNRPEPTYPGIVFVIYITLEDFIGPSSFTKKKRDSGKRFWYILFCARNKELMVITPTNHVGTPR